MTALEVATDAGRMAVCFALRRDWAPPPATVEYGPAMAEVLFEVAARIEAEQRIRQYPPPEGPFT